MREELSDKDLEVVSKQLGREPSGLIGIGDRCSYGYPTVLITKPLIINSAGSYEVFPTLYWLSCPWRKERIAKIESRGYVKRLESELKSDRELRIRYREAEERYIAAQRGLLSDREEKFIQEHDLEGAISRGIGGIESDENLKCLHLHVAHQLAGSNPIGNIVIERFGIGDCPPEDVLCERT